MIALGAAPRFGRAVAMVAFGLTAGSTLAACGSDASAAIRHGVVTVTVADFTFHGLPDEVPAGTRLEIENRSKQELHELVAVRLPDDGDRPITEVVLTVHELFEAGPPAAVLLAAPGGEQIDAYDDDTLSEPGRYLIVCSIPTGVDPHDSCLHPPRRMGLQTSERSVHPTTSTACSRNCW